MSKDAYYFSHDSNARNDQRLMLVRMKYGMEGYGIYFGIIEILREQSDYKLGSCQFDSIAFDLRVDVKKVEDIVMGEYHLFEWDAINSEFWSASLKRRMEKLDLIKQKRAEAGRKGGKSKPIAKQVLNKESKGKDNKGKHIKEKDAFKDMQKRYNDFEIHVQSFMEYDFKTLEAFFNYWTEPNKSNTKMKFEMQNTWDTKRRIQRWVDNDFNSTKISSLDKELVEKNKNIKKQSVKLQQNIRQADKDAVDFVPDLKAMMKG